jgi:O-antigen/teichoic acid export membrane protein
LNDRLDQIGRSMLLRGALSVVALSAGLYATHNVLWGCVGLALVWLAALLFFDVPRGRRFVAESARTGEPAGTAIERHPVQRYRRQWNLMRMALPLGISTTMAALNLHMPRYFIQARLGERQLGIYSAMAYATVAMILVADSLGHCAIPRLSRCTQGGGWWSFDRCCSECWQRAAVWDSPVWRWRGSWACRCSPCFMAANMPLTIGFSWY